MLEIGPQIRPEPARFTHAIAGEVYDLLVALASEGPIIERVDLRFRKFCTADPYPIEVSSHTQEHFKDCIGRYFSGWAENFLSMTFSTDTPRKEKLDALHKVISRLQQLGGTPYDAYRQLCTDYPELLDLSGIGNQVASARSKGFYPALYVQPKLLQVEGYSNAFPEIQKRIYLNCSDPTIFWELIGRATPLFSSSKLRDTSFKVIDFSFSAEDLGSDATRCDRMIIYVPEKESQVVFDLIKRFYAEHQDRFSGRRVPLFAARLMDGVGLGDEPVNPNPRKVVSFSELRSQFLLQVTLAIVDNILNEDFARLGKAGQWYAAFRESFLYELGDVRKDMSDEEFEAELEESWNGKDRHIQTQRILHRIIAGIDRKTFCEQAVAFSTHVAQELKIDPDNLSRNVQLSA